MDIIIFLLILKIIIFNFSTCTLQKGFFLFFLVQ